MGYGKSIELFLANGNAESLITAELSNWNGKAFKIPRSEVNQCHRDDIKEAGVYFLFCQEDDGTKSVYIGESENVEQRLMDHLNAFKTEKELFYWNTAVIFIGNDLNKSLIRYLEDRLFEIAKQCNRYQVLPKNTYKNAKLKESNIATMEEFIENIKILINALGYNVLVPMPKVNSSTVYLYCQGKGAHAKGFVSPGGFTVSAGSTMSTETVPSFEKHGKHYFDLRSKLERDGVIVAGTFVSNYEFNAPSTAAAVILGRTANGSTSWKTKDGTILKDL